MGLGEDMCLLGDVDGDFVADIAVTCAHYPEGEHARREVWLLSGRTGKTLRIVRPEADSMGHAHLGNRLAPIGDIDGDRVSDFAVIGTIARPERSSVWGALAISGADGCVLRRFIAQVAEPEFYPTALCGVEDWDGGGTPDVAVGGTLSGDGLRGAVAIFSAESGALVAMLQGGPGHQRFGRTIVRWRERATTERLGILVSSTFVRTTSHGPRDVVSVITGRSRATSLVAEGGEVDCGFGRAICWITGRQTGPCLVVAEPDAAGKVGPFAGAVVAIDSGTLNPLWRSQSPLPHASFGEALASCPDLDGDGVTELVVGAPRANSRRTSPTDDRGTVYVLSGKSGEQLLALEPTGHRK